MASQRPAAKPVLRATLLLNSLPVEILRLFRTWLSDLDRNVFCDSLDQEHTGNKFEIVSPKFARMAEGHLPCYRKSLASMMSLCASSVRV
jgi:hypothetical protein